MWNSQIVLSSFHLLFLSSSPPVKRKDKVISMSDLDQSHQSQNFGLLNSVLLNYISFCVLNLTMSVGDKDQKLSNTTSFPCSPGKNLNLENIDFKSKMDIQIIPDQKLLQVPSRTSQLALVLGSFSTDSFLVNSLQLALSAFGNSPPSQLNRVQALNCTITVFGSFSYICEFYSSSSASNHTRLLLEMCYICKQVREAII